MYVCIRLCVCVRASARVSAFVVSMCMHLVAITFSERDQLLLALEAFVSQLLLFTLNCHYEYVL